MRAVREPHFLLADNPGDGGGAVVWLDGRVSAPEDFAAAPPWDALSGQPNDCAGHANETCIFLGPRGALFDLHCAPLDPASSTNRFSGAPMTRGPEITWEDGGRREHSVAALCEVELAAAQFGVASLSPADVVAGWLA